MIDIYEKLQIMADNAKTSLSEKDKHGWNTGLFNSFRLLTPDKKGDIGESYIVWLLEQCGKEAVCSNRTDATNKHWDIFVDTDKITLEVKTATLGYSNATFQHENLEQNRRCDGVVFLDIAPNNLYITLMCKHTFDWKNAHKRRTGISIKKDFSLSKVKEMGSEVKTVNDFLRKYDALVAEINDYKAKNPHSMYY